MGDRKKGQDHSGIHKLSDELSLASLERARGELHNLQKLINESARLGEEMSEIVADLRQVAAPEGQPFVFTDSIAENKRLLETVFRDCDDVKMRSFNLYGNQALLVYLDGMTDTDVLSENVIKAATSEPSTQSSGTQATIANLSTLVNEKLSVTDVTVVSKATEAIESVMAGKALLLIDDVAEVLVVGTVKHVKRSVEQGIEDVMRGPHDTFNETLSDNIVLIRRRARDPNVKVRIIKIGERSKTAVAMVYVANLVKPGLLEEVERRLKSIKIDRVLASFNIEEYIVDNPWTPFPQVQTTERPDKVVASIYEGRVAIIIDNTPATMLAPCTYNMIMQSPEDYTMPTIVSSLVRFSRHISAFIAIYLPSVYVAVVSFHPGLMPTTLAISVGELRARSPFPSFLEAVAMEMILEIFQEAVSRLPQKIAGAASVVGGFIIGNTVVEAGLINPLLVVVVASTAIASYTLPSWSFSMALRVFRVPMLILASILGLYGVMIGLLIVTVHLCALRSFGESYLGGMFNITLLEDWTDQVLRLPQQNIGARPKELGVQERDRHGENIG
ncbi:spore germination protein [Sporomusa carbonis]|uniref:spore germination protein n=1 Tax=Sporomusa carbonis TaxID=3076075 RepID=UPI003C7C8A9B